MSSPGLRDRKKAQTRRRIADVAASLFAERGYDAVSMVEVARAADVSDQTVYNYFATKQELVLDRADQIRESYAQAVRERGADVSPARALKPTVEADIERYRQADLDVTRGEFLAQSVASPVLRRFTLEERERQVHAIADAIVDTATNLPGVVAHAHAAALVAVIQVIHDQIGTAVLDRSDQDPCVDQLSTTLQVAFTYLDRAYTALTNTAAHPPS
jgi:AcrR family transcriptional regulator